MKPETQDRTEATRPTQRPARRDWWLALVSGDQGRSQAHLQAKDPRHAIPGPRRS